MDTTLTPQGRTDYEEQSTLTIVPYKGPRTAPRRSSANGPRKRQRGDGPAKIRNACIACREKKTRCSGHTTCIRCQKQGQPCEYMPTASPTSYDSGASGSTASISHNPVLALSRPTGKPAARGSPSPTSVIFASIADSHSPAINLGEAEGGVTKSPEEALQQDQDGHFHGGSSEFAFLQFAKQRLAGLPSVSSILFTDHPLIGSGEMLAVLPPAPIAEDLARVFFDFGLAASRFVHEPSFFQSLDKLYSNSWHKPHGQEPPDTALVYMVLALGSHYSRSGNMFSGYSASVRFFDMGNRQLEKDKGKVTLASVQARLLGIHYMLNHSRMHEAWSAFGLIVRHAQALGLHRRSLINPPIGKPKYNNPHDNGGTHWIVHEFRKRVFWAIYINDRILSSLFGRPCALHDDDIDQAECTLANDEDVTATSCEPTRPGTFCTAAALLQYARVTRILGQVLRELYGASGRTRSISDLHRAAVCLEHSLLEWQDNLPSYLNYVSLPPSAMSTMMQRQMCTLKLAFCHTCLLIYRPFILYAIDTDSPDSTSPSHPQSSANSELEPWIRHCHEKAIEAAQTVVAECADLASRGWFSRVFWLVNYMQFAAVGTLYMYSYLWPATSAQIRDVADAALEELPVGVDGDMVGQRYLDVLKEMRDVTATARSPFAAHPRRRIEAGSLGMNADSAGLEAGMDAGFRDSHGMVGNAVSSAGPGDFSGFGGDIPDFWEPWSNLFFDTVALDQLSGDYYGP